MQDTLYRYICDQCSTVKDFLSSEPAVGWLYLAHDGAAVNFCSTRCLLDHTLDHLTQEVH